jgi:hypothetical protein
MAVRVRRRIDVNFDEANGWIFLMVLCPLRGDKGVRMSDGSGH